MAEWLLDEHFLDHSFCIADLTVDPVSGSVDGGDGERHIRRKELEVLALLASSNGKLVSREQFIDELWEGNHSVGSASLTRTIGHLRDTLGDRDRDRPLIKTVPRRGYQLTCEAHLRAEETRRAFTDGAPVRGYPGWKLHELLDRNEFSETWVMRSSGNAHRLVRFVRREQHLKRLRREVSVLQRLGERLGHADSVLLPLSWNFDQPPYNLVFPLPSEGSLPAWIQQQGGFADIPLADRIHLMASAFMTLAEIHEQSVAHGNLVPESLWIDRVADERSRVLLGEFGLARVDSDPAAPSAGAAVTLTTSGTASGRAYLAPEQQLSRRAAAPADVYAMGVLLYQMSVGDLDATPKNGAAARIREPQLRELIASCLDADPAKRPSAASAGAQLSAMETSDHSATASAVAPQPAPATEPESIGPYRLLKVLGEGGMGIVYLAEQREPVRREVALKLIRAGLENPEVIARLEVERQALALMEHPNVAAVFDAGADACGRPYFAMEYVEGVPITEFCDRHEYDLADRANLFRQVCDGVMHAHQKGLIHRDLTPRNLLVKDVSGKNALVKVIDFGVTKSMQSKLSDRTLHTQMGSFVGTPQYASPEQIVGERGKVDTRSDVYSLGIVLYELFAGVTPLSTNELEGASPFALVDHIRSGGLPAPSKRFHSLPHKEQEAIARQRSVTADRLKKELRQDLSWIILKATHTDSEQRYPSVSALKADLTRWLEGRPLEAKRGTALYHLRKFIGRHKMSAAISAVALIAVTVSTTSAVLSSIKARKAAQEAEMAADFQVRQIRRLEPQAIGRSIKNDLISGLPEEISPDVQATVARALEDANFTELALDALDNHVFEPALRTIEEDYADYPSLQAKLWQTMAETLFEFGKYEGALVPQNAALDLRLSLYGESHPLTLKSFYSRSQIHYWLWDFPPAIQDVQRAISGYTALYGENHSSTLEALDLLGGIYVYHGNGAEAFPILEELLARKQKLFGSDSMEALRAREALAMALRQVGQYEEADRQYRKVVAAYTTKHGPEHPQTIWTTRYMMVNRILWGNDEIDVDVMVANWERLRDEYGDDYFLTIEALSELAGAHAALGDKDKALSLWHDALEQFRASLGETNPATLNTMIALGAAYRELGDLDESQKYLPPATRLLAAEMGEDNRETVNAMAELGALYALQGRDADARPLLLHVVSFYDSPIFHNNAALALARRHLDALDQSVATGDR